MTQTEILWLNRQDSYNWSVNGMWYMWHETEQGEISPVPFGSWSFREMLATAIKLRREHVGCRFYIRKCHHG